MKRSYFFNQIDLQFRVHPICGLLGPRQVGKTTLAKMYLEKHPQEKVLFFDLENPLDLARLENPMLAFASLKHEFIMIDEIQRRPDLFPILRVLVDEPHSKRKFLILGSASRELLRQSSETLAGRLGLIELPPFTLDETNSTDRLWLRGGFPKSYLAEEEEDSFRWREAYITTFLEKDIPDLGLQIPPMHIRRFWMMLSHYHGQKFNASELGKSLGVSDHTVRRYLDILVGTFMIRSLSPWYENLSKRQIKTPKIYFRDSGLLHALLQIKTSEQLHHFPKLGSFWEGFALEETIQHLKVSSQEAYFWGTQGGAELDLMIFKEGRRLGFEFKYTDRPKVTPSAKIALSDLKLDQLYIVYPGKDVFPLAEGIQALGLQALPSV